MQINNRYLIILSFLCLALTPITGCRKESASKIEPAKESRPGRVQLGIGGACLWVEVAESEETRTQGLMYRRQMPEDEGMLFVFEYPQPLSFWMKNTYLPLDIAFVARDGSILNILGMKPLDEGPRYLSQGPALYAIEANAGWFRKNGIKAGDKVRF